MDWLICLGFADQVSAWERLASWATGHLTWWTALGLVGQAMFFSRFLLQWIASERAGRSVIPVEFWLLSLVGSIILLVYSVYRKDPVFMLAFAFNGFVYVRNLMLLKRPKTPAPSG